MESLEGCFQNSPVATDYCNFYVRYLHQVLTKIDMNSVHAAISCFLEARDKGQTIFFAGNGGSAATASHFAQDLAEVGRKANVKSFRTLSLTDNVSFITAMANDYGYEKIFSIQMSELFKPGDVLVAISASGNSPNVVEAVEYARRFQGISVGLVGFDGGKLLNLCDHVVHVQANKGEYGPVEDAHMILVHMISAYLIFNLSKEREQCQNK